MEFDLSWVLLGLPLAFVLGWLASRFDVRQIRLENRNNPKAYFKGLNFLLNEQQDLAIDAFIEAVQNDPDTSELHFALGNLFRRRGEFERAVRVHEHLLSRGDLGQVDRNRAQYALALDFLKAGLLDRAETALLKLEGSAFEAQARLALLANYERSRDWVLAATIAEKLNQDEPNSYSPRLAHYLCEQAVALKVKGQTSAAEILLSKAVEIAPESARARIELAQLQEQTGHQAQAWQTLMDAIQLLPASAPLMVKSLASLALQLGNEKTTYALLKNMYASHPCLDVLEALVCLSNALSDNTFTSRDWYVHHLKQRPSLVAACHWIAGEKLEHEQFHPYVQQALEDAVKPLLKYRCAACGFEATQHFWQCPGCQTWDSYPPIRIEEL